MCDFSLLSSTDVWPLLSRSSLKGIGTLFITVFCWGAAALLELEFKQNVEGTPQMPCLDCVGVEGLDEKYPLSESTLKERSLVCICSCKGITPFPLFRSDVSVMSSAATLLLSLGGCTKDSSRLSKFTLLFELVAVGVESEETFLLFFLFDFFFLVTTRLRFPGNFISSIPSRSLTFERRTPHPLPLPLACWEFPRLISDAVDVDP
mmetsp:Transcript_11078/g.24019  ORF Transcript_11078/g.24019 Transcript_11078/m.24019 type:complete len:206 (-) Transcript_11078:269-886(-)